MKIAVTGATGFVGSHALAQLSLRSDHQVVAVSHNGIFPENLGLNITKAQMDIAAQSDDAFDALGCPDVVLHLAWAGLPNYRSLHHYESELPRQYRFLCGLLSSGLKHLVVSGTCYEYGMQGGELSESSFALPANPYAYAKNSLRQQLEYLQVNMNHSFRLTWARLFYMYGSGQARTSLYSQLQAALNSGEPTFPMSCGEQLRDFLPVEEVARLLVELALSNNIQGIVNVCSGQPISIRRLVERWIAASGQQIALDLGRFPYADHEPLAFWGSAARLNSLLSSDTHSNVSR
jgi:nucleoside-diphosphate-sugar epimerase